MNENSQLCENCKKGYLVKENVTSNYLFCNNCYKTSEPEVSLPNELSWEDTIDEYLDNLFNNEYDDL